MVSQEMGLSQAVFFSADCLEKNPIIFSYFLRYLCVASGLGALY